MSAGFSGSVHRNDMDSEFPYYDQVPLGSSWQDQSFPPPPPPLFAGVSSQSLEPLPPPPLPVQPAVGLNGHYPPTEALSHDNMAEPQSDPMDIKPVHRFIPDSVKNFFSGNSFRSSKKSWPYTPPSSTVSSKKNLTTRGVPCSPPNSAPPSPAPQSSSGRSYSSRKEKDAVALGEEAFESVSMIPTNYSSQTYQERVEEYQMRYAYMKSWAGLLRILGAVQLLLGAAVFACVCAYVHKDNEWFNMYGYSQPQIYGGLGGGAGAYGAGSYYTGPKTPFVLVVAGLAWIVTIILVVLGMTLYYRAILLDSSWWPLTECVINLILAALYCGAGAVYVRDTTRGGMCNMPVFNNGVNGAFCRTEAGQTAAIVFLFFNMVLYFISAAVSLKLWRHEAARMRKKGLDQEVATLSTSVPLSVLDGGSKVSECTTLPTRFPDIMDMPTNNREIQMLEPEILRGHIPAGHIPKPVIIADYVAKYPRINSEEEKERYKAVFNDQYAEYKELHAEVEAMAKRFEEMDEMMQGLASRPSSQMEVERINNILVEYKKKKNDPTYLEKRERCEYLKKKLSYIKQKIHEYNSDKDLNEDK